SLMKINLDAAALEAPEGTKLRSRLSDCAKSADDLIRQTRTLTFDLHPAMLDDLGLVATLERYSREFMQRAEIEVMITENGRRRPLAWPLANSLSRAVKELLNNAARHGHADEIVIAVHWEFSCVRIVVDDNGAGFDATTALHPESRRGLGLPGIEERLASLG